MVADDYADATVLVVGFARMRVMLMFKATCNAGGDLATGSGESAGGGNHVDAAVIILVQTVILVRMTLLVVLMIVLPQPGVLRCC